MNKLYFLYDILNYYIYQILSVLFLELQELNYSSEFLINPLFV